jgi:hypothetical protein
MACNESNSVNVGDPILSHRESKYQLTSIKARKLRWRIGSLRYIYPSLLKVLEIISEMDYKYGHEISSAQ